MKKQIYILLTAISALFALSGCSRESDKEFGEEPVRGEIAVATQQGLNNVPAAAHSKVGETLRYVLEVWTLGAEPRCVLHQTTTGDVNGAVFDVALIPGTYDFLYWADDGSGYYTTDDLRKVKVSRNGDRPGCDAFACATPAVEWNGGAMGGVTLKRPVAKLTIQNSATFSGVNSVSVTYKGLLTQYDVLTGTASEPANVVVSFPDTESSSSLVGEDYMFAPSTGQQIDVAVTVGSTVKQVPALQLKPNYMTTLTATF
ncbi:DUF6562 domain-containing protein [Millionella massiliensis]|uniref:DUF6562 domain-containing protein n=1 Tax=Millionella massiliensis TaxID=1871023 RepID=UPI0008D9F3DA|nr:DUF6562 domain-containing protein [Millionella massiliensis]